MNNIDELIQENQSLKIKNQELEHKLQKYTNSEGHKRYYEKNKDIVKEKGKSYLHKLKEENPDKLKEYRRTAYLNRKLKLQNTTIENSSIRGKFRNAQANVAYPQTTDGYFYNYNNKWIHLMMQWNYQATQGVSPNGINNISIYVNGTYQNTLRGDNGESGAVGGDRRIRAGSFQNYGGDTTTNFLEGNFSTIEAYGRLLTSDEIYGNFYVSKSFFGY